MKTPVPLSDLHFGRVPVPVNAVNTTRSLTPVKFTRGVRFVPPFVVCQRDQGWSALPPRKDITMNASKSLVCGALLCLATPLFNSAWATSTYAEAYAAVSGYPIVQNSKVSDASGAAINADLSIPDGAFINSAATGRVGILGLDTWSRVAASTNAQGRARADWADGFIISAPGHDGSETGTFSGSVRISGTLLAEYGSPGFAMAISSVTARISLGPNTGFNGGNVSLQGGGRRINGTGFPNVLEGLEEFSLNFTNVPFTFDRGIDVYVRFDAVSSADSRGATTYAEANYALTWEGLSEVHDHNGILLTNYTAISPGSGFNYALAAVPEPSTALLLLGGGLLLACRRLPARSAQRHLSDR